jgi:hypothetical protein
MPIVKPPWVETTDAYVLAILAIGLLVGEAHAVAGFILLALAVVVAFYL